MRRTRAEYEGELAARGVAGGGQTAPGAGSSTHPLVCQAKGFGGGSGCDFLCVDACIVVAPAMPRAESVD